MVLIEHYVTHMSSQWPAKGAVVWGFADYPAPQVLQSRMNRFYLGVHCFAAVAVTNIEMDSVKMQLTRWLEMARSYN